MGVKSYSGETRTVGPKKATAEIIASLGVILLLSVIFSGFNRPMWIDEYLHFALAGVPWSQAFDLMTLTNANVNHGQTWFHQILSIATLNTLGAGTMGLRLVSWVSTVIMLVALYALLRTFSVPPLLRLLLAGILVAIPTTAFELGNSRSYIFLMAATAVSAWVLFSTMISKKTTPFLLLAFTGAVLLGAMSHPYFPVVLAGLIAALLMAQYLMTRNLSFFREKRITALLLISTAAGMLSVLVGYLTWMRGSPDFSGVDPYEWLPVGQEFFLTTTALFFGAVIAVGVFIAVTKNKSTIRQIEPKLAAGLTLVILGIGLSLFFSWVSISREYLVLPRQWLPGIMLFSLGATLLMAHILVGAKTRNAFRAQIALVAVLTTLALGIGIGRELSAIQLNSQYWSELGTNQLREALTKPGDFFSIAGNLNIKCGGVVWPEHSVFYSSQTTTEKLLPIFSSAYKRCMNE